MRYFDTSFVAPLARAEATSLRVLAFVAGLSDGEQAISRWVRVELASAISRDVRMGVIDAQTAREVAAEFDAIVERTFVVLDPQPDDYDLAEKFIRRFDTSLRGGDALHLAIAKNNGATAIHSLDKKMIMAGQLLGLPTSLGIDVH